MTTVIHFGVLDIPYADASFKEARVRKPKRSRGSSITTGAVAEILEDRYHVMETFYHVREQEVADQLAESYRDVGEAIANGAPMGMEPAAAAISWIEDEFKSFLSQKGMDGMGIPGVPTAASLRGASHRFKRTHARRASRPSFIDTGLYQASFRVMVEHK